MSRTYDILGVGDADIDIMVSVKNFPQTGQKSSGKILGQFPGGMVANFLASAATFGAKCCGVLCVGDDSFGKKSLSDLSSRGVQIKDSVVREGESTYFTTTCIAPDGEKRMILCFGGAVYPTEQEIKDESLASANYVHMTGGNTNLTIPVATRAKKLGTKVSFDLERLQTPMADETKDALLSLADIVFPNEEGLYSYSGCSTIEAGARSLLEKGPKVVVVTKGAEGVEVFTDETHFTLPALGNEVVDTTGAGDAFNGAFLASLCKGHNLQMCALLASAAAAIQISAVGCRTALATEEQAVALLNAKGLF